MSPGLVSDLAIGSTPETGLNCCKRSITVFAASAPASLRASAYQGSVWFIGAYGSLVSGGGRAIDACVLLLVSQEPM